MNHNPMRRYLYISILFVTISCTGHTQTACFKIFRGNKEIGRIDAKKADGAGSTIYTVTSEASMRIISRFERKSSTSVIWKEDQLRSSEIRETMNGKLKQHRTTERNGARYACKKNGEKDPFYINGPVRFCTSMLYFQEPRGHDRLFAESHQAICPLERIEPGIYKLTLPQGRINHYVYESGMLKEIRVFRKMINLVFKRTT